MKQYFSLLLFTCFSIFFSSSALGQSWEEIYQYNTSGSILDQPKVTVSMNDIILTTMENISQGHPIQKSTDGGQTWTVVQDSFRHAFSGFDSKNNIYLVSYKGLNSLDSLYYSSDAGATWQNLGSHANGSFRVSAFYIDKDDFFYTRADGATADFTSQLRTFKDGVFNATFPTPFDFTSKGQMGMVKLSNGNIVFSTFNDGVFWSSDNGQTWNESMNDASLGAVSFTYFAEADNGTLFLGGPSIQQCSDGGETWMASSSGGALFESLKKAPNGNLYAMSPFQGLWVSTDDGTTWVKQTDVPTFSRYRDFDLSANFMYLAADDKLYRYPISGATGIEDELGMVWEIASQADGSLTIQTDYTQPGAQVTLTTIHGKQVFNTSMSQGSARIPSNALAGPLQVYVLQVRDQQGKLLGAKKIMR